MFDHHQSMLKFIAFLDTVSEDPVEAHSLELVLKSGERLVVRIGVEGALDRASHGRQLYLVPSVFDSSCSQNILRRPQ